VLAALAPGNAAVASGGHQAVSRAAHSVIHGRPRPGPPVGRAEPAPAAPNLAAGQASPWVALKHAAPFDPGDDAQENTNFPLVRITNSQSGVVTYARTSHWTSVSIAPGAAPPTTTPCPPRAFRGGHGASSASPARAHVGGHRHPLGG